VDAARDQHGDLPTVLAHGTNLGLDETIVIETIVSLCKNLTLSMSRHPQSPRAHRDGIERWFKSTALPAPFRSGAAGRHNSGN
jgi:hypothetical protein